VLKYTPQVSILARHAEPARLQPASLCYAAVTLFPLLSFLTIAWSKEISETTRPIFTQIVRDGRHVGVDVQSGIDFPIGQGTLPWPFRREIDRHQ